MSSRDNTGTPPPSAIVSGYEQLWHTAGTMPDLVSYAAATSKLDLRDLAALVHVDQRHRHAAGATTSLVQHQIGADDLPEFLRRVVGQKDSDRLPAHPQKWTRSIAFSRLRRSLSFLFSM